MECYLISMVLCLITDKVLSTSSRYNISSTSDVTKGVSIDAKKEPINVERDCADFGRSVGRLQYRVWQEGDTLVALCAVKYPIRSMRFTIAWTVREENGFRKVLRQCEFDKLTNKSDLISCQRELKLPRPQDRERISCWVHTVNEWGTESATSCASDEITLAESVYHHWKKKYTPEGRTFMNRRPSDELTRRKLNPRNMFDLYVVHMEPYEQFQVCKADNNTQLIMKIAVVPNLDFIPHSITWNCTISFENYFGGNYTLVLVSGNASDPYYIFGTYMKTCKRTQENLRKSFRCEITNPITVDDSGQHIFHCSWINNNEECRSAEVKYNITTIKNWEEKLKRDRERALEEDKERQRWLTVPEHYRRERNRTNLTRDGMPWNVLPLERPGAQINAKQYLVLFSGIAVFLMAVGCVFDMILTTRRNKKEIMSREPCPCNLPLPPPAAQDT